MVGIKDAFLSLSALPKASCVLCSKLYATSLVLDLEIAVLEHLGAEL